MLNEREITINIEEDQRKSYVKNKLFNYKCSSMKFSSITSILSCEYKLIIYLKALL